MKISLEVHRTAQEIRLMDQPCLRRESHSVEQLHRDSALVGVWPMGSS